jgi:putative transcriptional regulator
MGEAFESIMRGLVEVKAHREGKLKLKTTTIKIAPLPRFTAKMVKTLRLALGFSQSVFACALGVSTKTVEAWESGRNVPSGAARRFLEVIRKDRSLLLREKIVVYHSPAARVRAVVKANPTKLRASGARAAKARSLKVELARSMMA